MTVAARLWQKGIPADVLASRYGSAPSQFLRLPDGVMAHYRDYTPSGGRSNATLVLLHGGSLSLFFWEPWVLRLRASMRIIAVDLPGHGLTGATPGRDYSPAAMEKFVDAFTQTLGLSEPFVLAGHSTGGHVAWRFALAHPQRLAGLVLIAPGGISDPGGPQGRVIQMMRAPSGAWLFRALFTRERMASSMKAVVFDPSLITPEVVDRAWELNNRQGTFEATVARMRGESFDPAMVARLKEIRLPVLLLWGRQDTVFPLSQADVFLNAIPSAKLAVCDQCGHWPSEEVPDQSAAEVLSFISKR